MPSNGNLAQSASMSTPISMAPSTRRSGPRAALGFSIYPPSLSSTSTLAVIGPARPTTPQFSPSKCSSTTSASTPKCRGPALACPSSSFPLRSLRLNSLSPLPREGNHFMTPSTDPARQLLRPTVATVAYRGGKALRGTPAHFASFHIGDKTRTPPQILAHLGDLFDWALSIARGQQTWHDSTPLPWNAELDRFHAAIKKFDDYLASTEPLQF